VLLPATPRHILVRRVPLTGNQTAIDKQLVLSELSHVAERVPVYQGIELMHAQKVISKKRNNPYIAKNKLNSFCVRGGCMGN
jgi:hypothetical protein